MEIERAAKLAIQNILKEGLTDIFDRPQEIDDLQKDLSFQQLVKEEVIKSIKGNSLDSLRISPINFVLLPKTTAFDFRRCALMKPLDTIKYTAFVLLFAEEIEKNRLRKSSNQVFSYRFAPSKGYLFDPKYNLTTFLKYVSMKRKKKKTKVFVSCDIANFYDRLNLHRLESILLSLQIDRSRVNLLNELLLFWAGRDSYGLPVGSNASRILAEASLIEVDNYLKFIGADFCRFVDDYRFFASNALEAHYWLTQLIERLSLEGLSINKSKTKLEDVSEETEIQKKEANNELKSDGSNRITVKQDRDKQHFRIIAGYGGTIPTRFRKPTEKEIEKVKKINTEDYLKKIGESELPDSNDIKDFILSALYSKKVNLFEEIPSILDKFPQLTSYAIDLLIKHKDGIPEVIREKITKSFASRLNQTKPLAEYIAISLIRILGAEGFVDNDALFSYFRNLRRNAGAYIGRAILDSIKNSLSRGQVIEIRQNFERSNYWEKLQIARIVKRHLEKDEYRPWIRNVKILESDLFLSQIIEPIGEKKKKGKKQT